MSSFWGRAATEFKAALFLPDDLMKMMFFEVYALGMPIFTPSRGRLAAMLRQYDYYHLNVRHRLVHM